MEKVYLVSLHDTVVRKWREGIEKGKGMHCEIVPIETADPGMLWGGKKSFIFVDCNEIPLGLLQM